MGAFIIFNWRWYDKAPSWFGRYNCGLVRLSREWWRSSGGAVSWYAIMALRAEFCTWHGTLVSRSIMYRCCVSTVYCDNSYIRKVTNLFRNFRCLSSSRVSLLFHTITLRNSARGPDNEFVNITFQPSWNTVQSFKNSLKSAFLKTL